MEQFSNVEAKGLKNGVKSYFGDYEAQINALWNGLKAEDSAYKALNEVISGIAGGEGKTPAVWLCENFATRYYRIEDGERVYYKKVKGEYKPILVNGVTARGILKRSALNAIESQRIGNAFKQTEI